MLVDSGATEADCFVCPKLKIGEEVLDALMDLIEASLAEEACPNLNGVCSEAFCALAGVTGAAPKAKGCFGAAG